jgi:hypothetical protein
VEQALERYGAKHGVLVSEINLIKWWVAFSDAQFLTIKTAGECNMPSRRDCVLSGEEMNSTFRLARKGPLLLQRFNTHPQQDIRQALRRGVAWVFCKIKLRAQR